MNSNTSCLEAHAGFFSTKQNHTSFESSDVIEQLWLIYQILSDCHKSDEIYYLLNAFRLEKKKKLVDLLIEKLYLNNSFKESPLTKLLPNDSI